MTQCRFCKSDIPSDATRCPHCTSFLDDEHLQGSPGQVTYIVDKGLVTFGKFAGSILAIFLTVGIFLYGVDVKQLRKEIEDTHVGSQKLDLDIKQAKMDLERETADIKKDVESAEASAREARETSSRMRNFLQEAEQSTQHIQQFEMTLLAQPAGSKQPSGLQVSQPAPTGKGGLRRQVFDAKNTDNVPGELVRLEGDAPIAEPTANEVYDNLEIIYRFFKDVFGWKIPNNKGKTVVITIHYGEKYNNGFWNGQQIVLGDGDGILFRKGSFSSLSQVAGYIAYALNQFTAQMEFQGQSGALAVSFANIMSCLVEQWQKKQTADEASWLVGAALIGPGFRGKALGDMANPGTAYDDPKLGKDPQPGHMKDYVQTEADNGGVHSNSGIPNRAFVLVAKAIGGHSWEKAGKIWYVTLTERLTANSDFVKCAVETVSVARDLFPEDPMIAAKVAKAWADVGVLKETSPASGTSKVKR